MNDCVAVPRRFLGDFIKAVRYSGHGQPTLDRARCELLLAEVNKLVEQDPIQPPRPEAQRGGWTDGDFLDEALAEATGSILSQYAADLIRKRAIEKMLTASLPQD